MSNIYLSTDIEAKGSGQRGQVPLNKSKVPDPFDLSCCR